MKPTRKKSEDRERPPPVRFEATIHPGRNAGSDWIDRLDIDRVPDPKGGIRALVSAADCVRLLNQGVEIHLHRAYPVQPLDPALIESDQSFQRRLEKELRTVKRATKKGPRKT
jgi:hypothetical protein